MTESEYRQAKKAWAQRNSDQRTTGAPLPERVIEEEEVPVEALDTQGVKGQMVTLRRHVHIWSVADPDAAAVTVGTWTASPDGDGDGHDGPLARVLAGTMIAPFTLASGPVDGDGDGRGTGVPSDASNIGTSADD